MRISRMPSLNLLRGFEAAGRHQSFSKAARELGVTQGAVSRQIKALEEELGVVLFLRGPTKPTLTVPGRNYWKAVTRSFQDLENATGELSEGQHEQIVTLSSIPTFAMRWLIPRLGEFQSLHPDIDVAIITYNKPDVPPLGTSNLTVLRSTQPPVPYTHEPLCHEVAIAVCHPEYLASIELNAPSDIVNHTLLANSTRPGEWEDWLTRSGIDVPAKLNFRALRHFFMTIQGAVNKMGIALVPEMFVAEEIRSGQLVQLFDLKQQGDKVYYLAYSSRTPTEATKLFGSWLRNTVEAAQEEWAVPIA